MTPFDQFISFVWRPENDGARSDAAEGEKFVTVRGVTAATWADAVADKIVTPGLLVNATDNQLHAVLKWCCWDRCWCNQIAAGGAASTAIVLANMAMLAGSSAAVKTIQRLLPPQRVDGMMGPLTAVAAIEACRKGRDMAWDFTEAGVVYLSGLGNAPKFLNGWTRRMGDCLAFARGLGA